jgi:hypothetical protein
MQHEEPATFSGGCDRSSTAEGTGKDAPLTLSAAGRCHARRDSANMPQALDIDGKFARAFPNIQFIDHPLFPQTDHSIIEV